MGKILIYGVNGFSGKRVARYAKALGDSPIIAGRNEKEVKKLAKELDFDYRVFDLSDDKEIDKNLKGVDTLLNLAGPYVYTAIPFLEACLRSKVHYLDITGEGPLILEMMSYDKEAKKAGIVILPAVGFDVVPTDCLALKMKEQMPDADRLQIVLPEEMSTFTPSHGTVKTVLLFSDKINTERVNGEVVRYPHDEPRIEKIQLPTGEVKARLIGWGDVFTAYHTTGIPNISDYFTEPPKLFGFISLPGIRNAIMNNALGNKLMNILIDKNPDMGPTREERRDYGFKIWGIASNPKGEKVYTLLCMGHHLRLAYRASYNIAQRVSRGELNPGSYTPAKAFGSDYVLNFRGSFYVSYGSDFEEIPDGKL